jgi:protein disulfide-isomerase A6|tara:strand:+ start:244 stop:675 length:432 start_codon:yes stop_codon:yes gene_type:complete
MKPDWDKLGAQYEGSSVVIGDADCTKEQELCSEYGVQGYPTIKYFTAETGKTGAPYQSGRDFDSLKTFVEETLSKSCEIDNQENCDEKEVKYIAKMQGKGNEAVSKQLARLTKMKGGKMKPELMAWLNKRLAILTQLDGKTDL